VLPVLLVASQYVSMAILSPKNDDPAQASSQAILKVLPLMIGWFSLNVRWQAHFCTGVNISLFHGSA
jgi:YidC/Oxa1 family membrane protein insertase